MPTTRRDANNESFDNNGAIPTTTSDKAQYPTDTDTRRYNVADTQREANNNDFDDNAAIPTTTTTTGRRQ